MSDDRSNSALKVPLKVFDGKKKSYPVWKRKILAHANYKGYSKALTLQEHLPSNPEVLSKDPVIEKLQLQAIKLNKDAMTYLTYAFQESKVMSLLNYAEDEYYEEGLAHKLIAALDRKFLPSGVNAFSEATSAITNEKFGRTAADPNDYFERIMSIKATYKHLKIIDDKLIISAAIAAAPPAYGSVFTQLLRDRQAELTLNELMDEMHEYWKLTYEGKSKKELKDLKIIKKRLTGSDDSSEDSSDDELETEKLLQLIDSARLWQKMCYNCGSEDHKAAQCPLPPKQYKYNQGRSNVRGGASCNNCGLRGHVERNCWEKAENAHRRPANWTSKFKQERQKEEANLTYDLYDSDTSHELSMAVFDHDFMAETNEYCPNGLAAECGRMIGWHDHAKTPKHANTTKHAHHSSSNNGQQDRKQAKRPRTARTHAEVVNSLNKHANTNAKTTTDPFAPNDEVDYNIDDDAMSFIQIEEEVALQARDTMEEDVGLESARNFANVMKMANYMQLRQEALVKQLKIIKKFQGIADDRLRLGAGSYIEMTGDDITQMERFQRTRVDMQAERSWDIITAKWDKYPEEHRQYLAQMDNTHKDILNKIQHYWGFFVNNEDQCNECRDRFNQNKRARTANISKSESDNSIKTMGIDDMLGHDLTAVATDIFETEEEQNESKEGNQGGSLVFDVIECKHSHDLQFGREIALAARTDNNSMQQEGVDLPLIDRDERTHWRGGDGRDDDGSNDDGSMPELMQRGDFVDDSSDEESMVEYKETNQESIDNTGTTSSGDYANHSVREAYEDTTSERVNGTATDRNTERPSTLTEHESTFAERLSIAFDTEFVPYYQDRISDELRSIFRRQLEQRGMSHVPQYARFDPTVLHENWILGPEQRNRITDVIENYVLQRLYEYQEEASEEDKSSEEFNLLETQEQALLYTMDGHRIPNDEIWVGDTGATVHLVRTPEAMSNTRSGSSADGITMGNGAEAKANQIGDVHGTALSKSGTVQAKIRLRDAVQSNEAKYNLLSLTRLMELGWKLKGGKGTLKMTKAGLTLDFDIRVKTPKGILYCIRIKKDGVRAKEVAVPVTDTSNSVVVNTTNFNKAPVKAYSVSQYHAMCGHTGEKSTRDTARHLGIKITGYYGPCLPCAVAGAKQKNVPRPGSLRRRSLISNYRVHIDISKINNPPGMPRVRLSNWLLIVDEKTGLAHTSFFSNKDAMPEPTCKLFQLWRQQGIPVKTVRMDNAGENKALEEIANDKDWQLGIDFEYTSAMTPQQNSIVEVKFATLKRRGRAMLIDANVPEDWKYLLIKEVLQTATLLDGLVTIDVNNDRKTRFEHWNGKLPPFAHHLKTWGEAGVVKTMTNKTKLLEDRGTVCMFVGYSTTHAGDCYRMLDLNTKRIHITRDIRWLNRMYFNTDGTMIKTKMKQPDKEEEGSLSTASISEDSDSNDKESKGENPVNNLIQINDSQESHIKSDKQEETDEDPRPKEPIQRNVERNNVPVTDISTTEITPVKTKKQTECEPVRRSSRMTNPPSRLISECGKLMTDAEIRFVEAMDVMRDSFADGEIAGLACEAACIGAGTLGGFAHTSELKPMKYRDAMKTKDVEDWNKAVETEYNKFKQYEVFEEVPIEEVPSGAKIMTTTWAMKKKGNGTYRARINMRGFEQEEGIHYDPSNIAAPVTNDVSVRIMFVLALMAGWDTYITDVQGAFLHGKFQNDEKIYTTVPEGFEKWYDPTRVMLLLKRTAYGLKQSAMCFWIEILKAMEAMEYKKSVADSCLYYKWNENGLSAWLSWVDDCLILGPRKEAAEARVAMNQLFDCDDIGECVEYVGCKLDWNKEDTTLKFTQPVLLQSYNDEFDLGNSGHLYKTPGEPGQVLMKCKDGCELTNKEQTKYRSGVGKLLHMMRWSRPELWNSVREVSRRMSKPNNNHMKALKRIMKYCIQTPNRGWTIRPQRRWNGKDKEFKFKISGRSDASYAACTETRRSVTGYAVYLEGALIDAKSGMQRIVTLSTTEAETVAAVTCAQAMMYAKKVLESIGLQVELPMKLEIDNRGAVDLANSWNTTGNTKHMDVRYAFLRELKGEGVLKVEWVSTYDNEADIFTKNVDSRLFTKHVCKLIGSDEYMTEKHVSWKSEEETMDRPTEEE